MGAYSRRRGHGAGCGDGQDRHCRSRDRARENSLAAAWAPLRDRGAARGPDPAPRRRRAAMIRYALVCAKGHSFESWFQNSAAYDKQAKRALVTCPICGTAKVGKEIM